MMIIHEVVDEVSSGPGLPTSPMPQSAPFVHSAFFCCDLTSNVKEGLPMCCALDDFDQNYPCTRCMRSRQKATARSYKIFLHFHSLLVHGGRFQVGANRHCSPEPAARCRPTLAVPLIPILHSCTLLYDHQLKMMLLSILKGIFCTEWKAASSNSPLDSYLIHFSSGFSSTFRFTKKGFLTFCQFFHPCLYSHFISHFLSSLQQPLL